MLKDFAYFLVHFFTMVSMSDTVLKNIDAFAI